MTFEDFIGLVIEQAGKLGLGGWERIAIILGLAILLVLGKVYGAKALASLKKASGPVDNAPGSDGSAPGDEEGRQAARDGVASGKYRYLRDDPNTPADPSGGGG